MRSPQAILPRLLAIWALYQNQEAPRPLNALLATTTRLSVPTGVSAGKPMPQEIAKAPLTAFALVRMQAIPLRLDAALMTDAPEVDGPSGDKMIHVTDQVGKLWV